MASASFVSIVRALQLLRYADAALPSPIHRSLPVPIVEDRKLRAGMLYARGEIVSPKDGYQVWPPSYVGYVDLKAGRLESLRAVVPRRDFACNDDPQKPLGTCPSPAERTAADVVEQTALYLQACDEALSEFAEGAPSPGGLGAGRTFLTAFHALSEKPLAPYYQALSPQFFAWAKRVPPAK